MSQNLANSKLAKIIRSLTPQESKTLDMKLQTASTENQRHLNLFRYIKEKTSIPDPHITKEEVFSYIFVSEPFSSQRLRDVMSQLSKQIRALLVVIILGEHSIDEDLALMSYYIERALPSEVQKIHKKISRLLDLMKRKDLQWYEWQLRLSELADKAFLSQGKRGLDENLKRKAFLIDVCYLGKRLKSSCELINRMDIVGEAYDLTTEHLFQEILNANVEQFSEIPTIRVYKAIFLMLLHSEDVQYFITLQKTLSEDIHYFLDKEARSIYKYAQNYCIKKINQGHKAFTPLLMEIYKQLLSSRLILIDGRLSPNDYKNIVTVGLRNEEHEWVEKFIHQYKTYLPDTDQANSFNYNLASFYYETQRYDQALDLLNTVDFVDVYYQVSTRFIIAKTYYETAEFYSLEYFIIAFRLFLSRNKEISKTNKKANLNFLILLSRLAKLKEKKDFMSSDKLGSKLAKLQTLLDSDRSISNKHWISKQLVLIRQE